jgi:hydroxyacylglutathione hydrolase
LVDGEEEVILLTDAAEEGEALAAADELAMIGIDRVTGWYGADAFASWSSSGRTFDVMEQVDAAGVAASMHDEEVVVVDVRAPDEWAAGHLPGAVHAPLGRLRDALDQLPADARIVMQCQGGGRSAIATSLARLAGRRNVVNLRGGFDAWRAQDLPVEAPSHAVSG